MNLVFHMNSYIITIQWLLQHEGGEYIILCGEGVPGEGGEGVLCFYTDKHAVLGLVYELIYSFIINFPQLKQLQKTKYFMMIKNKR